MGLIRCEGMMLLGKGAPVSGSFRVFEKPVKFPRNCAGVGTTPVRSELVYMLVRLDKEYNEQKPAGSWEGYYARALIEHFTGS